MAAVASDTFPTLQLDLFKQVYLMNEWKVQPNLQTIILENKTLLSNTMSVLWWNIQANCYYAPNI